MLSSALRAVRASCVQRGFAAAHRETLVLRIRVRARQGIDRAFVRDEK